MSKIEGQDPIDNNQEDIFDRVGRSAYVHVDLDAIANNIQILRKQCPNPNTGVIAVVKAGAYGHGSVVVSRHLKSIGVERLAVATIDEAVHLRKHGISGPVHLLGNVIPNEMAACLTHNFIPTVNSVESVEAMGQALLDCQHDPSLRSDGRPLPGSVHIKVDTGMSRNGCQPDEFAHLVQLCQKLHVPLEGAFTHFADSWDDAKFTSKQLKTFQECVKPYRDLKLHVANSGAILTGIGTELDFIRPGIAVYGLPPGDPVARFSAFGFCPAAQIKARPTLVKELEKDRCVGYGRTYHTDQEREWVGTFPVGYADGFWRHLSSVRQQQLGFVIRDKTGEKCPIIGRVSMDAITAKLPCQPGALENFTLMSADYDPHTSAAGIADRVGTIPYEVVTRLSLRYPRVYSSGGQAAIVSALQSEGY